MWLLMFCWERRLSIGPGRSACRRPWRRCCCRAGRHCRRRRRRSCGRILRRCVWTWSSCRRMAWRGRTGMGRSAWGAVLDRWGACTFILRLRQVLQALERPGTPTMMRAREGGVDYCQVTLLVVEGHVLLLAGCMVGIGKIARGRARRFEDEAEWRRQRAASPTPLGF